MQLHLAPVFYGSPAPLHFLIYKCAVHEIFMSSPTFLCFFLIINQKLIYTTFQGNPLVVNIPGPTIQQTNVAANGVPVAMPTSHRPMLMKVNDYRVLTCLYVFP